MWEAALGLTCGHLWRHNGAVKQRSTALLRVSERSQSTLWYKTTPHPHRQRSAAQQPMVAHVGNLRSLRLLELERVGGKWKPIAQTRRENHAVTQYDLRAKCVCRSQMAKLCFLFLLLLFICLFFYYKIQFCFHTTSCLLAQAPYSRCSQSAWLWDVWYYEIYAFSRWIFV